MTTREDDETSIASIVDRYRAGFAAMDPEILITVWDPQYDGIVYVAQEVADPIHGWAQVEAYYRRLPSANPADRVIEMRVDDLSIDIFGDVALAFCTFHFVGEADGRAFVADGRVTFLLHRQAGEWKVIHYHESAPPVHLPDG